MYKSDIQPLPQYFDRYINQVEDIDLMVALKKYHIEYLQKEYKTLKNLGDKTYEEGKWTVKEVLQHVIDTERIMAYRALRIARKDPTPLPGFDQDILAATAKVSERTVGELLKEYELVRESNIIMFKTFTNDMLMNSGISNNSPITALALGFVIVGHCIHHVNVLKEKYFPLLQA